MACGLISVGDAQRIGSTMLRPESNSQISNENKHEDMLILKEGGICRDVTYLYLILSEQ